MRVLLHVLEIHIFEIVLLGLNLAGCSCYVQFQQDGLEDWFLTCDGHTALCFHFPTMRPSTGLVMLSTVTSFCLSRVCTIAGVSSVSRVCNNVILAGWTAQEGARASALAWIVHSIL